MKIGDLVKFRTPASATDNLGIVIGWDDTLNKHDPLVEWIYPTMFWMSPSFEYKEDLVIVSEA